jgi:hypothetical protein
VIPPPPHTHTNVSTLTDGGMEPTRRPLYVVDEVHLSILCVRSLPPSRHGQFGHVHWSRGSLCSRGGAPRGLRRPQAVWAVRFAGILPGCRLQNMAGKKRIRTLEIMSFTPRFQCMDSVLWTIKISYVLCLLCLILSDGYAEPLMMLVDVIS